MPMDQVHVWVATLSPLALIMLSVVSLIIIFIPSFIAFSREHPNRLAILVLNIFLGWTGIGWLILLIWAIAGPSEDRILQ